MDSERRKEQLADLIRGRLDQQKAREVTKLLESSESIRREYESLKAYFEALDTLEPLKASDDFLESVHARIEKKSWLSRATDLLIHPLPVKLPVEIAGLALTAVIVVVLFDPFQWLRRPAPGVTERPPLYKRQDAAERRRPHDEERPPEQPEEAVRSKAAEGEPARPGEERFEAGRVATSRSAGSMTASIPSKTASTFQEENRKAKRAAPVLRENVLPAAKAPIAAARANEAEPRPEGSVARMPLAATSEAAAPAPAPASSPGVQRQETPVMTLTLTSSSLAAEPAASERPEAQEAPMKRARRQRREASAARTAQPEPPAAPSVAGPREVEGVETILSRNGARFTRTESETALEYRVEIALRNLQSLRRDLTSLGILDEDPPVTAFAGSGTVRFSLRIMGP